MADRQFVLGGIESAPADWVLPDALEIEPKTAYASFNGAAAVTTFQPTLRIISDSGHVEGEYPIGGTVAAGGSADCTWFPGVSSGGTNNPPIPGTILSLYGGKLAGSDFTTNSTSYVQSNFPTNTSFTKVSSLSALGIYGQFDFTSGAAPDTLFLAVFIDGVNYEATGVQVSQAGSFITAVIATVKGIAGTTPAPLAAGVHTVDVRCACNAGVNFTLRTSTSVDLSIVEFVT